MDFVRNKASLTAQFAAAHGAALPSGSGALPNLEEERQRQEAHDAERRRLAEIAKQRKDSSALRKSKQRLSTDLRQYIILGFTGNCCRKPLL